MKRNKLTSALIFCTAAAVTAFSGTFSSFAGEYNGEGDASLAVYKNTLTIATVTLTESEAADYIVGNPDNKSIAVDFNVASAGDSGETCFNSVGLSNYFDNRLEIVKSGATLYTWKKNSAGELTLATDYGMLAATSDISSKDSLDGVFVALTAMDPIQEAGTLYTLHFQLPADFAVGDEYPIEIMYDTVNKDDCFKYGKEMEGLNEQAWTYTYGITGGRIQIVSDPPQPESIMGDVNDDGSVDSSDAALILKDYAAVQGGGTSTLDNTVADYNGDDAVDSSDAALILKAYADNQANK